MKSPLFRILGLALLTAVLLLFQPFRLQAQTENLVSRSVFRVGILGLLKPQQVKIRLLAPGWLQLDGSAPIPLPSGFILQVRSCAKGLGLSLPDSGERKARTLRLGGTGQESITLEIQVGTGFRRNYQGPLLITPSHREKGLCLIVLRPLESLVTGSVAAEAPPGAPEATLKALAITARSFILSARARHAREGFDLCDSTHCLFYRGEEAIPEPVRQASAGTEGEILDLRGQNLPGPFTACCGGIPLAPAVLWPGSLVPSPRTDCPCRGHSPYVTWRRTLDWTALETLLNRAFGCTKVEEITVQGWEGASPQVQINATPRSMVIPIERFRIAMGRVAGWNLFRSNRFTFHREGGMLHISGRGFGHGAGLCLAGALELGRTGRSADSILAHYFPGTRIIRAHDSEIFISSAHAIP